MINITDKTKCSGCSACRAVCPVGCITMQADEEGFLYPQADADRCLSCGLCDRICPVTKAGYITNQSPLAFGAVNHDPNIQKSSSSGGVFSALAEHVLASGGVVFGAAYDPAEQRIKHTAVCSSDDLDRLRGSKYVQSEIGDTYHHAKERLESGQTVLYSGTPCQIAGLLTFLQKPYNNLITQDIICHGVPSPLAWDTYLNGRQPIAVSFRDKSAGWISYSLQLQFPDGDTYREKSGKGPYLTAFANDLMLRPCCYDCAFKGISRAADITLADFWGVWDLIPDLHDPQGVSLVFVHSEKGQALWQACKDQIRYQPVDVAQAVGRNTAMIISAKRPRARDRFLTEIRTTPFDEVVRRYTKPSLLKKLKQKAKNALVKIKNSLQRQRRNPL